MGGTSARSAEPTPTAGLADATVVLTYYGWNAAAGAAEAAAYVEGVESGGRCTLTLTSGDRTVTADQDARADAKTVQCGGLSISGRDLAGGQWNAVVSYSSANRVGRSEAVTIEVPR